MASMLLLIAVFVLDLIAFALAVAAEQRRNTAKIVKEADYNYCQYDSDVATGLGAGSFVLLLASQALIMVASRCLCCGRALRPGGSRAWAVVLFIFCWYVLLPDYDSDDFLFAQRVFFFIAEVCLLAGSVTNARHTKYRHRISDHISCETLRKGVFGAGAAFVVLTGIVSELYYVSYSKANDGQLPYGRDAGIRMQNF